MKSYHIINGTILVIIGLLVLGLNIGFIDTIPWANLLRLWPVYLIALGLSLIFQKGIFKIIPPLLLIAAIVLAFWMGDEGLNVGETVVHSLPLEPGVEQAKITPDDIPVVNFKMEADKPQYGDDYSLKASHPIIITPVSYDNHSGFVHYRATGYKDHAKYISFPSLNLELNQQLSWEFDFDFAVANSKIDLRGINWNKFLLETAVGNTDIFVDQNRPGTMRLKGGVSRTVLHIPKETNVRIHIANVATIHNLKKEGFTKVNKWYYSPNYDFDEPGLEIEVDVGLLLFSVEWID